MRDIKTLDLNLLKVLNALIEERSVTKAALRLGLTQPAVSGILVRLRESFCDPLLIRARNCMVPTHRAMELAPRVKRVLMDVEDLLQPHSFAPKLSELTLAIAASDYMMSVVVTPFISALRVEAPGIRTIVRPLSLSMVTGELENGGIDIALSGAPADAGLHVRELFKEEFVCVMREDHPKANEPLSIDLFCSLDHALVGFDGGFAGVTDRALAEVGRKRRVVLSVSSFIILPTVLQSTDLIAVMPTRFVSKVPGLILRAPPISLPGFTLSAIWHERSHLDPARAWARSQLFKICDRLDEIYGVRST